MSEDSCYHDFDSLLLIDWRKAQEGDLTRLRISGGSNEQDIIEWEKINDEYTDEFGTSRKHFRYLQLLKKMAILQLDMIITEDQSLINDIQVIEEELESIFKSGNESHSLTHTLIALTDRAKVLFTESNITAKYFFTLLDHYGKASK